MTLGRRKQFGRRGPAPPVVTNAPQGLPGAPHGLSPFRKRSLAVALISLGAGSLGIYALLESRHRDCPESADQSTEECRRSSGGHGGSGSGRSWWASNSSSHDSSSSSSGHESASSGHSSFFGGFGHAGFGHGGGS